MLVRAWNRDTDYDTLVKWWTQWEFGVVPKDMLPPDGIIVEDDGVPICAGGLYFETKKFKLGFMEWIVTDKESLPKQTHKALKLCIDAIIQLGKDNGVKMICTCTKEAALHKRYTKYHKMIPAESNVKTFVLDLDGAYSEDLTWISDDEQIASRNK